MTAILIILAIINIVLAIAMFQINSEVQHMEELITAVSVNEYEDSVQDDLSEIFNRLHAVEQVAANAQAKASNNETRLKRGIIYEAPVQERTLPDE